MRVQIVRPEELRLTAKGPGVPGQEGVIYQTMRNGNTMSRTYIWNGERHVQFGQPEVESLVSGDGIVRTLAQSGIPFILPSSGNIASNGNLSSLTGLPAAMGWSYLYFPAGAVYAGSAAGWYLCNMTGATFGTIYNNTYLSGQPSLPASPTPIVAAGPGAYTQTTGIDIPGPQAVVEAGAMGPNGAIQWERVTYTPNNANNKVINTYLGATVMCGHTATTITATGAAGTIKNRGDAAKNTSISTTYGDANAGSIKRTTVDTAQAQIVSHALQLAVATDYAIIESFGFYICPKS
jgi:hypothetical protein